MPAARRQCVDRRDQKLDLLVLAQALVRIRRIVCDRQHCERVDAVDGRTLAAPQPVDGDSLRGGKEKRAGAANGLDGATTPQAEVRLLHHIVDIAERGKGVPRTPGSSCVSQAVPEVPPCLYTQLLIRV